MKGVSGLSPVTDLMPHQVPAVEKLMRLRVGAAFMEMGTGKTRVGIELAARRWGRINRLIWACPVSLKQATAREIAKHSPSAAIHIFDDNTRAGHIPPADVYVIGIESLSSSVRVISALDSITTSSTMVVVDESTMIKGHRAQRTKWATLTGKKARYRLILTGTPITRDVSDLYSQMYFLDEKVLGYRSWYSFAANHLEYHPTRRYVVRAHNLDWLAAKVAPFVYSCTKKECLDLPSKLYGYSWRSMTDPQRELYDYAKEKLFDEIEKAQDSGLESVLVYRLFGALQQIACGFWREIEREKPDVLHEVPHERYIAVDEALGLIPTDERVIIWTKYRRCAAELQARYSALCHTGDQSPRDRDTAIQTWKSGANRILVATPATGGYGLNLTEGAYAIYHSNGMKYSERLQSEDRIHRIGQTRPATYCDVGIYDSIDERIMDLLAKKSNLADEWRNRVQLIREKNGRMQALRELLG